jgi:hypothetical protein
VFGMSCGQLMIVVLLLVLLLLVAGILALALGWFRGAPPPAAAEPTQMQTSEIKSPQTTAAPLGSSSPVAGLTPGSTLTTSTAAISTTTGTPAETGTALPTPTNTPTRTITPTPPPDVCTQLNLRFLTATSNVVQWRLANSSGIEMELTRAQIEWPQANEAIFNVFLNGSTIWSSQDLVPPTIISSWIGTTADRTVDGVERLELTFGLSAAQSGYNLRLWFGNGCQVAASR